MTDLEWLDRQLEEELNTNHLEILLDKFPDADWRWDVMSKNPNLTWEIIKKFPDKKWNWVEIPKHPNITWDIIKNNPEYPWDIHCAILNPSVTWQTIQDNPNYDWEIGMFAGNPNVTWEILKTRPGVQWYGEQDNPNLEWKWMRYIMNMAQHNLYEKRSMYSKHPCVTYDIICDFPEYCWDPEKIFSHKNIMWEHIQKFDFDPHPWFGNYTNYMRYISENPNITWEIVKDNIDKDWNWHALSSHSNITWEIIRDNPDYDWDSELYSSNVNITVDIIQENPHGNWYMIEILHNPNITHQYIIDNYYLDEIDWVALSYNVFNKNPIVIRNIKEKYTKKKEIYCLLNGVIEKNICRSIVEYV